MEGEATRTREQHRIPCVKVYLDVSCLNRPFDDQNQFRVRMEAEAISLIIDRFNTGEWQHVSSEMATIEIDAMSDKTRRAKVHLLLPPNDDMLELTEAVWTRASRLETLGFKAADAAHIAAAEECGADVFLSCDDRLCRLATRRQSKINVHVFNPVDWLREINHAPNS